MPVINEGYKLVQALKESGTGLGKLEICRGLLKQKPTATAVEVINELRSWVGYGVTEVTVGKAIQLHHTGRYDPEAGAAAGVVPVEDVIAANVRGGVKGAKPIEEELADAERLAGPPPAPPPSSVTPTPPLTKLTANMPPGDIAAANAGALPVPIEELAAAVDPSGNKASTPTSELAADESDADPDARPGGGPAGNSPAKGMSAKAREHLVDPPDPVSEEFAPGTPVIDPEKEKADAEADAREKADHDKAKATPVPTAAKPAPPHPPPTPPRPAPHPAPKPDPKAPPNSGAGKK